MTENRRGLAHKYIIDHMVSLGSGRSPAAAVELTNEFFLLVGDTELASFISFISGQQVTPHTITSAKIHKYKYTHNTGSLRHKLVQRGQFNGRQPSSTHPHTRLGAPKSGQSLTHKYLTLRTNILRARVHIYNV